MSYFNTTNETGTELRNRTARADAQQELVLGYFREHRIASASQVHKGLGERFLLTSVRRSITNLYRMGTLAKTPHKAMGPFGANEYKYAIRA